MILLVPHDTAANHSPVLQLITLTDASVHCREVKKPKLNSKVIIHPIRGYRIRLGNL